MLLRRTISLACPIVCTLCLVAGYAANGWGIAMLAGASTGLAWWLAHKWAAQNWTTHKRSATSLPVVAFVISIAWTAVGLLTSAPALLMILSATFALASWDLVLFDHLLADNPISSNPTIALFQNRHYRSLALTLGFGLLIVLVGRTIQVQISFVIIGLFVLLALFSIDRLWRALKE
jgi:hypothetical protein